MPLDFTPYTAPSPERNFYTEYSILNAGVEIPKTFTRWCSVAAVSAVLCRSCWIDMGPFRVYPNNYIILVAGSGKMRKSTAVGVTRGLLDKLQPPLNVIAQKVTTEALFDAISTLPPMTKPGIIPTQPIGQGYLVADELTNFLNKNTNESQIATVLTELYDCRDTLVYHTKGHGKQRLANTQLGILAATTPEELRRAVPESVISSGLSSRFLFVFEDKPAPPNYLPVYTVRQQQAKEYCVAFLERVRQLSGPIPLSADCHRWMKQFYDVRCYNSHLSTDTHLSGYASRRYIHTLKLAISLAVGLRGDYTLSPDILSLAEELLLHNEEKLGMIIRLVSMNQKGSDINLVLDIIRKSGAIGRQHLLSQISHKIDSRELNDIIDTLKGSSQIRIDVKNGSISYVYLFKDGK